MSDRTITATGMPAIDCCPECESHTLNGTTVEVSSTTLELDGSGGILTWQRGDLQDTLVLSMECYNCGAVLIEDGEVVHDGVDDE